MINFKEYLKYYPETGIIMWIKSPKHTKLEGKVAGEKINKRYSHIKFKGKSYQAHHIAWYLYYGEWPKYYITHKNRVKSDNRIENLEYVEKKRNYNEVPEL